MFEATIELFDDYYRRMDEQSRTGFVRDLGVEVRERLQQLDYLLARVVAAEDRIRVGHEANVELMMQRYRLLEAEGLDWESDKHPIAPMSAGEMADAMRATFEARLFTECFYLVAGRIRTILRARTKPLPGLHTFEAVGVRTVRNQLLEHAGEGANEVTIPSFGFGGPQGPVVKAARPDHQVRVTPDAGLYANAAEFRDALDRRLHRELRSI